MKGIIITMKKDVKSSHLGQRSVGVIIIVGLINLISLLLLLLVRNSSGFGLTLLHLSQIRPNGSIPKRVGLRRPAVLLVGGAEAADQGIEAAPRLFQRARAGGRRVGLPEKDTPM